jgi:hypothetical protein
MKNQYNLIISFLVILLLCLGACSEDSADKNFQSPTESGIGQGGSLARFTIAGDYLYTVSTQKMTAYNISNITPQKVSETIIGAAIETIFPYQDKLFIGSQTGMYIYSRLNPAQPTFISLYEHIQSCDPVVAQGNYAYVTLRSGTDCRFGSNLLDVIDISNPSVPSIVNSYQMLNPHGLGVDGTLLFVCEGEHGIKIYDITDPTVPELLQFIEDFHAYDVIPRNGILIITGEDGIFQYQYNQENQTMTYLSRLE